MSARLAVFTPQLGTVSETFIRRHVEDILPARTVAVALRSSHPMGGRWPVPCPTLYLDWWQLRPSARILRRLGVTVERLRAQAVARFLRRHRVDIVLGEYLDQFAEFAPLSPACV